MDFAMKYSIRTISVCLAVVLTVSSCFKEPKVQGYLGEGIRLQGSDTMLVAIGTKVASSTAWLDNSTRPCHFRIENVRDEAGNRADGFFREFPTRLWAAPYDYLTDKTMEQVMSKLTDVNLTPLMINEINGQLRTMESTAAIGVKAGEIYHVDVSVTNSKGSVLLEDYAVIKFQSGSSVESAVDFELTDMVNGICITAADGTNTFPYYDQINASSPYFSERRQNIYEDNGREKNMAIRKISNEPSIGIKVFFKMYDKDGKLFDPSEYASYSTTSSYIDYSVNRTNDSRNGMSLEFPYTPWPVGLTYSYIRGAVYTTFDNLEFNRLKADNKAKVIPYNAEWPADDSAGSPGWYVRFRSNVTFYQPGTYEFVVRVPYTSAR